MKYFLIGMLVLGLLFVAGCQGTGSSQYESSSAPVGGGCDIASPAVPEEPIDSVIITQAL